MFYHLSKLCLGLLLEDCTRIPGIHKCHLGFNTKWIYIWGMPRCQAIDIQLTSKTKFMNQFNCKLNETKLLSSLLVRCQQILLLVFKWYACTWRWWKLCFMLGWRSVSYSVPFTLELYMIPKSVQVYLS